MLLDVIAVQMTSFLMSDKISCPCTVRVKSCPWNETVPYLTKFGNWVNSQVPQRLKELLISHWDKPEPVIDRASLNWSGVLQIMPCLYSVFCWMCPRCCLICVIINFFFSIFGVGLYVYSRSVSPLIIKKIVLSLIFSTLLIIFIIYWWVSARKT